MQRPPAQLDSGSSGSTRGTVNVASTANMVDMERSADATPDAPGRDASIGSVAPLPGIGEARSTSATEQAPPLCVAVGLGDPEREQAVLPLLGEGGRLRVVARCLGASELIDTLRCGGVDVALASADLHRLNETQLEALTRTGVPLVLLVPTPDALRWQRFPGAVLPLHAPAGVIRETLEAAGRRGAFQPQHSERVPAFGTLPASHDPTYAQHREHGERGQQEERRPDWQAPEWQDARVASEWMNPATAEMPGTAASRFTLRHRPGAAPALLQEPEKEETAAACASGDVLAAAAAGPGVVAVAGGPGSPGRTTVALALSTALGAVAPTLLVDCDALAPSLIAHLAGGDPTRNLYMLAHAEPTTPREWDRALAQELQPLAARSPLGMALCGIPKPEMRAGVSEAFLTRLLEEVRGRYRYVVLDVGADLLGTDAALHRAAVTAADQVLVVAAAEMIGLWHARTALRLLQTQCGVSAERMALVLNRHDRRYHQRRGEIEWALGIPAAAVVPFDHGGVQRALAEQHSVVLDERSRAGRALLDLAERLHGGALVLPPEAAPQRALWKAGVARLAQRAHQLSSAWSRVLAGRSGPGAAADRLYARGSTAAKKGAERDIASAA